MSESWQEIASNLRVAERPVTSRLLKLYWQRDEALREQWCPVPQLNVADNPSSWTTLLDSWLWVPGWASVLNVELATFIDVPNQHVRLSLDSNLSSELIPTWTSTQDDVLTLSTPDGTRSARHELLIQANGSPSSTVDVTLKSLWWSQ